MFFLAQLIGSISIAPGVEASEALLLVLDFELLPSFRQMFASCRQALVAPGQPPTGESSPGGTKQPSLTCFFLHSGVAFWLVVVAMVRHQVP